MVLSYLKLSSQTKDSRKKGTACQTESQESKESTTYTMKVDHNPTFRVAAQQLLSYRSLQLLCNFPRNSSSKKLMFILQINI